MAVPADQQKSIDAPLPEPPQTMPSPLPDAGGKVPMPAELLAAQDTSSDVACPQPTQPMLRLPPTAGHRADASGTLLAQRPTGDKQTWAQEAPVPAHIFKPVHLNGIEVDLQEISAGFGQQPSKEEKEALATACAEDEEREITHVFSQRSHNGQYRPLLISDAVAEQKVSATFGVQEENVVSPIPEAQEHTQVQTVQTSPAFCFWSSCCNNKAVSDEELNELKWSSGSY